MMHDACYMMLNTYHVPVLLEEIIQLLAPKPGDNAIDCTLGGGGHSLALLKRISHKGKLLAIDADPAAIQEASLRLAGEGVLGQAILVNDNFVNINEIVNKTSFKPVQVILLDLGLSSYQLDTAKRGFSFWGEEPLNMQFSGGGGGTTAWEVVNNYPKQKLKEILAVNADIGKPGDIAHRIVRSRGEQSIKTTSMLVEAILGAPLSEGSGADQFSRNLPPLQRKLLTKVFQAIRIEVNRELQNLRQVLPQLLEILSVNGRLAVISYHSGEDRIVKHFFRAAAKSCICPKESPICRCTNQAKIRILTKKAIKPQVKEISANSRARSAILRVIEKLS